SSRRWSRSPSPACRSPIRDCSTTRRRAHSRSTVFGRGRSLPAGLMACAWTACGCTSVHLRRWRMPSSASAAPNPRESEEGRGRFLAHASRVYTVPSGRPFLTALAEALLSGQLPVRAGARPGPLQLADTTLLLPTRRATRALQDAFLKAAGGAAV